MRIHSFLVLCSLVSLPIPISSAQAAVFTVINVNNSGAGSLRDAITQANATANVGGPDEIHFAIPGTGLHTISPTANLPDITDPVIIDGYTQAGSSPNTNGPGLGSNAVLTIELNGTNAGPNVSGLTIETIDCTVRGLVINRFGTGGTIGNGILVSSSNDIAIDGNFIGTDASGTAALPNRGHGLFLLSGKNNRIGGAAPAARNVISGNGEEGIEIEGGLLPGHVIQGNLIGTDASGASALGNGGDGIVLFDTSDHTIGGSAPAERNVISGNHSQGINIGGSGTGNVVQGNFIGTDASGAAALGNEGGGVFLSSADNLVGGTAPGTRNVVSGNVGDGVNIFNPTGTGNSIQGNFIGTDATGVLPLGNTGNGVGVEFGAADNTVGGTDSGAGNTIAFNAVDGVNVATGTGNAVWGNLIFSNGDLGVDLMDDGLTANDPGDGDVGANSLQNFPELASAVSSGGTIAIQGTLQSTAGGDFRLEFFANSGCDASGNGEGQTFLGAVDPATADGSGNLSFNASLPAAGGLFITALATNLATNDTSEFSECLQALAEVCDNDVDDEGDGVADCADSDCDAFPACVEVCDNGVDDDGNGEVDCDDPECAGDEACAGGGGCSLVR